MINDLLLYSMSLGVIFVCQEARCNLSDHEREVRSVKITNQSNETTTLANLQVKAMISVPTVTFFWYDFSEYQPFRVSLTLSPSGTKALVPFFRISEVDLIRLNLDSDWIATSADYCV